MSLNSLAASQVARALSASSPARMLSASSDDTIAPKEEDVQNALSALVEYVPAETVTIYVSVQMGKQKKNQSIPKRVDKRQKK